MGDIDNAINDRIDEILLDASEEGDYCYICVRPYHGHGPHISWGQYRWLLADPGTRDIFPDHYIHSAEEMLNAAIQMYGDLALDYLDGIGGSDG